MEKLRLWLAGWLFGHMALDFAQTIKAVSDRVDSAEKRIANALSGIENLKIWNRILEDNLHEANKASVKTEQNVAEIRAQLADANAEIDRLRAIVCTTPEVKAQIFKPRRWSDAKQLLGQGL